MLLSPKIPAAGMRLLWDFNQWSSMADVLIAGGGIAGSSLAVMLGRAGLAVELFERGRFPKEKPCGEGLMPAGVGVLERYDLAGALGGAPFYGIRYYAG